jgi:acyl-coenzyme A thioesterase PaaI-like protein
VTPSISAERIEYLACHINPAHRAMGTELLGFGPTGLTLRLPWREDLADVDGGLSASALTVVLDHVCSLAAVIEIGQEERVGPTISLRVDHLEEPRPRRDVLIEGFAVHAGGNGSVLVRGRALDYETPSVVLAMAVSTISMLQ